MKPFWRDKELSSGETELLEALFTAHANCVERNNVSTAAVAGSAIGSGDYLKAIACGMLSLGHLHAPLAQCMAFLSSGDCVKVAQSAIAKGLKIPGWGSSFGKDGLFSDVDYLLNEWSELHRAIDRTTKFLHGQGKEIHPNPGCYTAAVALVLRMPPAVAPWLFLQGRLEGWSMLFLRHHKPEELWA